jgi:hypothetical protein
LRPIRFPSGRKVVSEEDPITRTVPLGPDVDDREVVRHAVDDDQSGRASRLATTYEAGGMFWLM